MSDTITEAKDCIVKVGSQKAGGIDGRLIISDFEVNPSKSNSVKHGIGDAEPQARVEGNEEYDISFTHEGENTELVSTIDEGNFTVVLEGDSMRFRLTNVDYSDYSVSVDSEEYTLDFNGNALGYNAEEIPQ